MKNSKKVIASLAATLILTTSAGYAQGVKYTIKTYFNNGNIKYTIDSDNNLVANPYNRFSNIYRYIIVNNNNEHNNSTNSENVEKPNAPEKPVESKTPANPTSPQTKPEESKKPETPQESTNQSQTGNNAISSIEQEVARLVNIERQKAGLAPLTLSTELSKVARIKSQDMADKNYFSHTSPTYGDPFAMMKSFGIKYGYAGENIAKGYNSAESVMNGWMNSSGHRANILNPNFKTIGVGYVKANGTTYWTQMFTD